MKTLTREQVRDIDRRAIEEFGIHGLVLMENAGRGAVDVLARHWPSGSIAIVCGKGNNGGDGYVMARYLANRGRLVQVYLLSRSAELTGDALANYRILERAEQPVVIQPTVAELESALAKADVIVDAILGTGLAGSVRGPAAEVIALVNQLDRPVLAVDIPSGLDANTGDPLGTAIRADVTVTFVAPKAGFAQPAAQPYVGQIEIVDIGVPQRLLEQFGL